MQFAATVAAHSNERCLIGVLRQVPAPQVNQQFIDDRRAQVDERYHGFPGDEALANIGTRSLESPAAAVRGIFAERIAQQDQRRIVACRETPFGRNVGHGRA